MVAPACAAAAGPGRASSKTATVQPCLAIVRPHAPRVVRRHRPRGRPGRWGRTVAGLGEGAVKMGWTGGATASGGAGIARYGLVGRGGRVVDPGRNADEVADV